MLDHKALIMNYFLFNSIPPPCSGRLNRGVRADALELGARRAFKPELLMDDVS